MDRLIQPGRGLQFLLSLLIVATLAYLFWTGSRYPSLNEKAMMSGAILLEDALSFEAKYPITERSNVLLERGTAGYNDTASAPGLEVGGWS